MGHNTVGMHNLQVVINISHRHASRTEIWALVCSANRCKKFEEIELKLISHPL